MRKYLFCLVALLAFSSPTAFAQEKISFTDVASVGKYLEENFEDFEAALDNTEEQGQWTVVQDGRALTAIVNLPHDRLRVMTPLGEVNPQDAEYLHILLEANFGSALDVRYAMTGKMVWAVYLHSFSTISSDQLVEALRQVAALAQNTGTTFASTELIFEATQ